mmetsp:Transcript_11038/g.35059  ORF Transcript_11038/g.35059 Transcript_11038/m.35059 type:complete len:205 (-) Transcript_11038:386-1000(-)
MPYSSIRVTWKGQSLAKDTMSPAWSTAIPPLGSFSPFTRVPGGGDRHKGMKHPAATCMPDRASSGQGGGRVRRVGAPLVLKRSLQMSDPSRYMSCACLPDTVGMLSTTSLNSGTAPTITDFLVASGEASAHSSWSLMSERPGRTAPLYDGRGSRVSFCVVEASAEMGGTDLRGNETAWVRPTARAEVDLREGGDPPRRPALRLT